MEIRWNPGFGTDMTERINGVQAYINSKCPKSSYPYRIGGTFSDVQSTLLSFIQPFFFCGKP